jgi:GAF domain-containing protein
MCVMGVEKKRGEQGPDAGRGLLQAALDQLVDAVWTRLPCQRVSIMLADGEGERAQLGMAAWRGEIAEEAVNARVGTGASVAGRVYATARAQSIDDVDGAAPDLGVRGEGGSFVCMPLPLDGRVLGVISVRRPRGDPAFSVAEKGMLDCLSLYGGKAIQAAQLAYLLNSGFARRALESEQGLPAGLTDVVSQGTAQPAHLARLLAKSFYREMKSAGFGPNQIVGAAGEIIDQLSASLRKHGQRIERRQQ